MRRAELPARRAGRTDKPLLLWFDVAATPQGRELRIASARFYRLTYSARLEGARQDVASRAPDALCFETDIVDASRLETLQHLLHEFPQVPTLLLTEQHSEALAVWAFRAGVWNYLVKPVSVAEFAANLAVLARCRQRRLSPRTARPPQTTLARDLPSSVPDAHVMRLQPALQYVRQQFREKITEGAAAALCGLQRTAFSREFHATFGLTFREYLMRSRIGEARRLLAEGGHPVTEVVYASGFTDGSHFARMFKRYTGVLPSAYVPTEK